MTMVTPLPELLESLRAHGLRKGLPGPMNGPMDGPMPAPEGAICPVERPLRRP